MEIRSAQAPELEELVELQRLVFRPDEEAQPRYWAYVREEPTYQLSQSRVVVDGGRIVAHLRVWDRQIQVRGAQLRAGGIGSVLTRPDCRGQGYASALLADAVDYMASAGYDLGLLFSIIGTEFYGKLGWTGIPLPTFKVALGPLESLDSTGARPLELGRDLDGVMAVYQACTAGMSGPEVRPVEYWKSGPSRLRGVFPTWGVEEDGQLVAYVNAEIDEQRCWIKEACALDGAEAAYGVLAPVVAAQTRLAGLEQVEGSLPKGHPLVGELEAVGGSRGEWGSHDEMMVKLANWDSLESKWGAGPPVPGDEKVLWNGLLGLEQVAEGTPVGNWLAGLPPCQEPFYWWSDIF